MATILKNPPAEPPIRLLCPLCGFTVLARSSAAALEGYVAHVEHDGVDRELIAEFGKRMVRVDYDSASVSTIVTDLVTRFAPGFTVAHVAPNLPVVEAIQFPLMDMRSALTLLAHRVDAYWYVDRFGGVHFFVHKTPSEAVPS